MLPTEIADELTILIAPLIQAFYAAVQAGKLDKTHIDALLADELFRDLPVALKAKVPALVDEIHSADEIKEQRSIVAEVCRFAQAVDPQAAQGVRDQARELAGQINGIWSALGTSSLKRWLAPFGDGAPVQTPATPEVR